MMMFSIPPILFLLWSETTKATIANPVASSVHDFPYDENGKLSTHLLVYPEGPCANAIERTLGARDRFQFQPIAGQALEDFFGPDATTKEDGRRSDVGPNECPVACAEVGVDRKVVSSPLPERLFDGESSGDFYEWFVTECTRVEVGYMNYVRREKPLDVYWVDPQGTRHKREEGLKFGERHTQFIQSFLGHTFLFADEETGEEFFRHTVNFTTIVSIGTPPPYQKNNRSFHREIKRTLEHEWTRHNAIKRTFSPLGFAKGRLPDDLWGSIGAFYYNNRNYRVLEEWSGRGVFVNWWEYDVNFIQIPWSMKYLWQRRLKELVEDWVGEELDITDMYGLRQYEEGARLLTHVDRESTHAASFIINVAQGNLTEDWPVEVHDHADRLHEVVMSPGDIVYYESAKCLHGRNRPLTGEGAYYVNLFAHYRPKGDPDWYRKENPEGAPERLLDVGECKRVDDEEGWEKRFSKGVMRCDDERVGINLSPTSFQANSGADLYAWWRSVSPKGGMGYLSLEEEEEEEEEKDHYDYMTKGNHETIQEL